MATKSDEARAQAVRDARPAKTKQFSGRSPLPSQPPRRSKGQIPAGELMAEQANDIDGLPTLGVKQPGSHTEKRATVKIEASSSGHTSRKSTRTSANRAKAASPLTTVTKAAARTPKVRADKANAARATRAGAKRV